MATSRSDDVSKMTLRIEDTADNFSNRILNYFSPTTTDEQFYTVGSTIATNLLAGTLDSIKRTNSAILLEG